ncbi:MAG: type IX secretion system protein PorQ [Lentimicrobiaceae bacterium]|nr:type IX secretion system protein PorQ [Lentimicrobiaceae bacterium]
MKKQGIVFLFMGCLLLSEGQTVGGLGVYNFLKLPVSARSAALGGGLYAVRENDPALALMNPSMLNPSLHTGTAINIVDYFSDAVYGNLNYIHHFQQVGTFNFGFNFASYGSFEGYDVFGNETGKFYAGDYALIAGYGKDFIDSVFSMGMNAKLIFSKYETYFSAGLGVDVATSYYLPRRNFALTLLLSNIGSQFNSYADTRERLPFEIQLGFSQKLEHLPARYSITLQHLQRWNLYNYDPSDPFTPIDGSTGNKVPLSKGRKFAENLLRHFAFGLEILPMEYLSFQVSYNYNTRQEMRIYDRRGVAGLAYGFGLHIQEFHLYYARSHGSMASVPNHFTLSTNIQDLVKNKQNKKKYVKIAE